MGLEDYIVGWRDAIGDTVAGKSSYTESDYTKMYITLCYHNYQVWKNMW